MSIRQFITGKQSLAISVLTLLAALSWMLAEIYHAFTASDIPQVLQRQISPLDPQISQEVLDLVEAKTAPPIENNQDFVNNFTSQLRLENETLNSLESTESGLTEPSAGQTEESD